MARKFSGGKFINDPNDMDNEYISGLVLTYSHIHRIRLEPQVNVVLRAPEEIKNHVAIISGGQGHGLGLEGFIGEGMLDSFIFGDNSTSPPVDTILATIRQVTGSKGCLLIVMNCLENRLKFGTAAYQAKAEGFEVETVIVGEDYGAMEPFSLCGRRGLAGIMLVMKIAGAAAAAGCLLEIVASLARKASKMVRTVNQLSDPAMNDNIDDMVSSVLSQMYSLADMNKLIKDRPFVVILVNGFGGTPSDVLMKATRKAVCELQEDYGVPVHRVYAGSFVTFLEMEGFSISVMMVDDIMLKYLDGSTQAPYWPVGVNGTYRLKKL